MRCRRASRYATAEATHEATDVETVTRLMREAEKERVEKNRSPQARGSDGVTATTREIHLKVTAPEEAAKPEPSAAPETHLSTSLRMHAKQGYSRRQKAVEDRKAAALKAAEEAAEARAAADAERARKAPWAVVSSSSYVGAAGSYGDGGGGDRLNVRPNVRPADSRGSRTVGVDPSPSQPISAASLASKLEGSKW